MKRILLTLAMALAGAGGAGAQVLCDSAWRSDVKTVTLTREGVELEAPVLTLGRGERLLLQFDVLAEEPESLRYVVAHCDADWRRDGLQPYEFMNGFEGGPVADYDFSFTTRQPYVHYHHVLPEAYGEFVYSGNYILYVVNDDSGDTLLSRRFWVSEESAKVRAEVGRPYDGIDIERRQEVDVSVERGEWSAGGAVLRPEYLRVRVQQNGRQDNARWLEFSGYDGPGLAYGHRQCNIFDGGNTFRYFDASNLRTPMYNVQRIEEYGGETFALLRPEEDRSRKHYLGEKTLNGGLKVNIWDRQRPAVEADYVWVNFSLPLGSPLLGGEVFVVGQLTDWKLDTASRMEYMPQYKAYVKRLLLKQGYYAYQLLYRPMRQEAGETALLEGDHRETPNTYTVFVYQRAPGDLADRLVGVAR